ncbi:hypothetical protein DAETH_43540 (plasmid) [Deinococcus aetherius]|uniref:Uncharacterized protein n=1 Tax=Deinococcus aetherius TaxID=200252 RepID=A0ABN6RNH9_9DEIO|nr:hypothetical protein [Deinococcus aetherius]BDP44385.1 hypothetical protein DAETH_43540 [Deinococcus aetherius]
MPLTFSPLSLTLLLALGWAGAQGAAPPPPSAESGSAAAPAPTSAGRVTFTFTLPPRVTAALISLPLGDRVLPSSTWVNGQPAADPAVSSEGLTQWNVPGGTVALSFEVPGDLPASLTPGVAVQYDTGLTETLEGSAAYRTLPPRGAPATARDGLILSPAEGTGVRGRSSTNVTVRTPLNADVTLRVNGEEVPQARVGRRTDDPARGETTREFIGVPLRPGENTLTAVAGDVRDEVRVRAADVARGAVLRDVVARADGFTPITATVEVRDAAGERTVLPFVTVEDPGRLTLATPDADPGQSGMQLRVVDGQAEVRFSPLSGPVDTRLVLDVNGHRVELPMTVAADQHRTLIAAGAATLNSAGEGTLEARGTLEAPVGPGQLTVNLDSAGAHQGTPEYTRYPSLGDQSEERRPLEADGLLAARYDHPGFTATYARGAARDPVFGRPDGGDTLNVRTNGDTRVTAYLAPYAGNTHEAALPLNGTRVSRLPAKIDPQRARLFLQVTVDGVTTEKELVRGVDFVTDEAGVVTFPRAVVAQPDVNTTVSLIARGPGVGGEIDPGAQVAVTREFRAGEARLTASAGVHASSEDLTVGARLQVEDLTGPNTATADLLVSGAAGGTRARLEAGGVTFGTRWSALATHEDEGYAGVDATGTPGHSAALAAARPLTKTFGVGASLRYLRDASGTGLRAGLDATYTPSDAQAYTLGVFTGTGTLAGTGLSAGARLTRGPWTAQLAAQQAFDTGNGQYGATLLRRLPLPASAPNAGTELAAGMRLSARRQDGDFSVSTAAVLTGRSGPYTASLEYALPTTPAAEGEARGSVQATWSLRPGVNLGAQLGAGPTGQQASVDARVNTDRTVATAGVDLGRSVQNGEGRLTGALRFSVSHTLQAGDRPVGVTADGLSVFGADGSGHRYGAGFTYRGEEVQAAAYARLRAGTLTSTGEGTELSAEVSATRDRVRAQDRVQLALRAVPGDADGFAAQAVLATRYWLNDRFGVGAAYRGLFQPSLGRAEHAFGVEGTYRVMPEAALTVGYNFGGFTPITAEPTRAGAYLRLEFMIDELTGERR